jgi:hypothetical protein
MGSCLGECLFQIVIPQLYSHLFTRYFSNNQYMKVIKIKLIFLAAILVLALHGGTPANAATVVFNNIPASPAYYQNAGNWLGTLANQYAITATTFTPSASGQLDELTLGLFYVSGVNSVTLRLSPDTGGLPGAPIWQANVPPAPGFGSLLSVTGIGGPLLNASQTYWLEGVAPVTPATLHVWETNNQGDAGPIIGSGNYYANQQRFSLRVGVLGSTVPEPAACTLSLCGSLGLAFVRRRRS